MYQIEIYLLPPGWHAIQYTGLALALNLRTRVKVGTVIVKCLAREHNTMFGPGFKPTPTQSGVKWTNHEAFQPPFSSWRSRNTRSIIMLQKPDFCLTLDEFTITVSSITDNDMHIFLKCEQF